MRGVRRRRFVAGLAVAIAALTFGVAPNPAAAQAVSLDRARSAGWVGELPSGYLGIRESRAGISELVDQVNNQRRQRYRDLATTHGVPMAEIERQAGAQLIGRLGPGQYYMEGNAWRQR